MTLHADAQLSLDERQCRSTYAGVLGDLACFVICELTPILTDAARRAPRQDVTFAAFGHDT